MLAENYVVSQPYACDNLTIFLIHGEEKLPEAQFLTLQEALEQKKLIVHETRDVNELAIENVSLEEVYLQAGDIVKGGLQDRVFAYDVIVPAQSGKIPVGAFCVEQGRWRQRETEKADHFSISSHRLHSKDLKIAAAVRHSQAEVWDKVSEAQDKLTAKLGGSVRAQRSATSLQLTMEDEKVDQRVERFVQEFSPIIDGRSDVIGYAFVINGKVNSADLYASGALFRKLWQKLLKASALEAVAEFEKGRSFAPVTADDVIEYLNDSARDKAVERQVTSRIRLITQETDKTILQDTCDQERSGAWIHRSCLVK
jgi:ARG and Rhodanese-Phosphatase-superfamily-associated Protein domain